jgi:hypothetical protein
LTSFDITSFLIVGSNVIEVTGQNGIGAFAGCSNCTYTQHPAGVVFGGAITAVPTPSVVLLSGSGLFGFFGFGRFQRNRQEGKKRLSIGMH